MIYIATNQIINKNAYLLPYIINKNAYLPSLVVEEKHELVGHAHLLPYIGYWFRLCYLINCNIISIRRWNP